MAMDAIDRLTPGQCDCLRLVQAGFEAKEIGVRLGLTTNVVNERLRVARQRLGVTSSRQAARLLVEREGGLHNPLVTKPFVIADVDAARSVGVSDVQGEPAGPLQTVRTDGLVAIEERSLFQSPQPFSGPALPSPAFGERLRDLNWWQKLLAAVALAILIALVFAGLAAVMAAGLGALSRS